MPLYLFLTIDGNGNSEIVLVFLTLLEGKDDISAMIQKFKEHNPQWINTKVIMTDKDFTERIVFTEEFPDASLQICLFHTLRSFRREVNCVKMGIRSRERDYVLELLSKLAYSRTESDYNNHYHNLLQCGFNEVIKYYNAHWHDIRYEWVECYRGSQFTLGERTIDWSVLMEK